MIDKYSIISIYQIDNGWVVKVEEPECPNLVNQVSYISTFFKTLEEVADYILKLGKEEKK